MQNHEFSSYCSTPQTRSGCRQPSFSVYCFCSFVFLTHWCRETKCANRTSGMDVRANKRETWPVGCFFLSFPVRPRWPSFSVSYFFLALSIEILERNWPEIPFSWMTTERFREESKAESFAPRAANLLELGNRKRKILPSQNQSFHLSSPDEWSGCPATDAEFLCFCFAFYFWHTQIPPKTTRSEPTTRRNGTLWLIQFLEPDEMDERHPRQRLLPSGYGFVFLSLLRSGSHNQPSFCVFLLFSLIFNTRCLIRNPTNRTSTNHQKSKNLDRHGKRETSHRSREIWKQYDRTERDHHYTLFTTQ